MKAIETEYNGYRFRSRTEARWAVFLDSLGVKYRYEWEGYDLGNGDLYLPDFYLPQYKAQVEVKPKRPTYDQQRKLSLLSEDFLPVFFIGQPGSHEVWVYVDDLKDGSGGTGWEEDFYWHVSDSGHIKFWFDHELYPSGKWRRNYYFPHSCFSAPIAEGYEKTSFVRFGWEGNRNKDTAPDIELLCNHPRHQATVKHAIKAARGARFEHGETPGGGRMRG